MVLSVDGLRQSDLTDPKLQAYLPNITNLQKEGITYTNAFTTIPSDSFPGTLAYFTGAVQKLLGYTTILPTIAPSKLVEATAWEQR